MDRVAYLRFLLGGISERSTMKRLTSCATILFTAALLLVGTPHAAHAQSGVPLTELLRSTHIHGLAVDRADSGRLLIATHHGLHALRLDTRLVDPVSERQDDFMGFRPHPTTTTPYASGHPARGGNLGFITSSMPR